MMNKELVVVKLKELELIKEKTMNGINLRSFKDGKVALEKLELLCSNLGMEKSAFKIVSNKVETCNPPSKTSKYDWAEQNSVIRESIRQCISKNITESDVAIHIHIYKCASEKCELANRRKERPEITQEKFLTQIKLSAEKDKWATKTFIHDVLAKSNYVKMDNAIDHIFSVYTKSEIKAFYETLKAIY